MINIYDSHEAVAWEDDKDSVSCFADPPFPAPAKPGWYAAWYDNGSGFFDGWQLFKAATPEEALQLAGGPQGQCVTASFQEQHDPNFHPEAILAGAVPPIW